MASGFPASIDRAADLAVNCSALSESILLRQVIDCPGDFAEILDFLLGLRRIAYDSDVFALVERTIACGAIADSRPRDALLHLYPPLGNANGKHQAPRPVIPLVRQQVNEASPAICSSRLDVDIDIELPHAQQTPYMSGPEISIIPR